MTYGYQWKRCDGSGSNCSDVSGATARSYTTVSADIGATIRAAVNASNSAGTASAVSAPTATVASTPPAPAEPTPPPSPPAGQYWSTAPLGTTGLPRADSYCAANIIRNSWEPRPQNFTANHRVPADLTLVNWDTTSEPAAWLPKRALVTGNFTGTTTEIIAWAACKWGLDEDTLRAVAAQESHWDQAVLGDVCGPEGLASYGLTQIKNKNCSGSWIWGGYPWSKDYTALNVDLYGAAWRGCFEGNFSEWGIPGKDLWGCVGKWYSGSWFDSGANSYIASVKQHLANRTWQGY
jgi:autotransporter family porin